METQEAYQAYLINANAQADYMNTLLWLLFIFTVLAPITAFVIYLVYKLATIRKCPLCSSKRTVTGVLSINEDNRTITKPVTICLSCGHEF